MIAQLFVGESGGARLLVADNGTHDGGEIVVARIETVPAGPGPGGEATFTALYIVITSDADGTVEIIPVISGEAEDGTPFEQELEKQEILVVSQGELRDSSHQIGLSVPYIVNNVEVARFAPRATWFRARIKAMLHGEGDMIFSGLGVEMEVVRESVRVPAPAPVPGS